MSTTDVHDFAGLAEGFAHRGAGRRETAGVLLCGGSATDPSH
jgi:hypothetical protein